MSKIGVFLFRGCQNVRFWDENIGRIFFLKLAKIKIFSSGYLEKIVLFSAMSVFVLLGSLLIY